MRRRLWATIVELDLQAALSLGALSSISYHDYDCRPPSNIDDEHLVLHALTLPTPQSRAISTRTSFLAILAETFDTRSHIARLINSVRITCNYEEILELSTTLTHHISGLPEAFRDEGKSTDESGFRTNLLLFLIYRSLLVLHRPYFLSLSESGNKVYSYSQKISVQASIAILSPLAAFLGSSQSTDEPVPSHCYLHLKGGMFREELFHAAAILCLDIRLQSHENLLLPGLGPSFGAAEQYGQDNPQGLFSTIEQCLKYFEIKVQVEKRASKSFMLLNMLYASAKYSILSRRPRHQTDSETNEDYYTLEKACPRASKRCLELLMYGVRKQPSEETAPSGQLNMNADENADKDVRKGSPDIHARLLAASIILVMLTTDHSNINRQTLLEIHSTLRLIRIPAIRKWRHSTPRHQELSFM